jgi:hypothetical protein
VLTYLISGDQNIHPSHENIRRSGRRVRHGHEVDGNVRLALQRGKRFVVVAHGNEKGTSVAWFRRDWKEPKRWLYVGMAAPPVGTRVYLYCCYAGIELPRYLKKSEVFGHTHEVPMPIGPAKDVVLAFFSEVDRLMRQRTFDRALWRNALLNYLASAFAAEVLSPTTPWSAAVLLMLLRSLGFSEAEQ